MRWLRRWQRNRDRAREIEQRSLAAMGYNPERCMMLMFSAQAGRDNPRLMCQRRNAGYSLRRWR